MRKRFLTTTIVFLSVLLICGVSFAAVQKYKEVDAQQVKELMDTRNALVVFPLSPIEFDNKHIKGSVNIPMSLLASALPEDKNRDLVFYCLGVKCVASWRAAEKATELGYKNVYAFREGVPGWEKAGYPIETINPLPDVSIEKISTQQLSALLARKEVVLLDVNLVEDAEKFFIDYEKRIHIPLDDLKADINQLPDDKKICVVCLKGKRAPTAAKYLTGRGYKNVVVVDGGVQKWVLEGRPVARH